MLRVGAGREECELTSWATALKASNARVKKRKKPMLLSGGNEEGRRRRRPGGKVAETEGRVKWNWPESIFALVPIE